MKAIRIDVEPKLHAAIKSQAALEYRTLSEWCLKALSRQVEDEKNRAKLVSD